MLKLRDNANDALATEHTGPTGVQRLWSLPEIARGECFRLGFKARGIFFSAARRVGAKTIPDRRVWDSRLSGERWSCLHWPGQQAVALRTARRQHFAIRAWPAVLFKSASSSLFQKPRPSSMRKDQIQTRKRKSKKRSQNSLPAVSGELGQQIADPGPGRGWALTDRHLWVPPMAPNFWDGERRAGPYKPFLFFPCRANVPVGSAKQSSLVSANARCCESESILGLSNELIVSWGWTSRHKTVLYLPTLHPPLPPSLRRHACK